MSRIAFLLVPGLHLLDPADPAQAFSTAADSGHPYTLGYIAEQPLVPTAQGLPLAARLDWPELGPEDLIVAPGWRAPSLSGSPAIGAAFLQALRDHHARGGTVAGVCAGAEALGRAGLLNGRRCTTHHDVQDELARRYLGAMVVRDVLYTADDRVVTSAGIAGGIDVALHLIATRHGPAVAARVARNMVVHVRRNGHEPQASAMLRYRSHLDDTVHCAQDLLDARFDQPLPLPVLATAVGVSERTLTRLLTRATGGLTPLRCQQTLRLERAEHLISHGATVDAAARAVGFEDPRMLLLRARGRGLAAAARPGRTRTTPGVEGGSSQG